jgi:hypothetical protein
VHADQRDRGPTRRPNRGERGGAPFRVLSDRWHLQTMALINQALGWLAVALVGWLAGGTSTATVQVSATVAPKSDCSAASFTIKTFPKGLLPWGTHHGARVTHGRL